MTIGGNYLLGCCVSLSEMEYVSSQDYDFVELQVQNLSPEEDFYSLQTIIEKLKRIELPVYSFNAFLPPQIKVVGPEVNQRKIEKFVANTLKRINELGGKYISFGSGASRSCPIGFSVEQAKEQINEFLEITCFLGEQYGIQINIEGLNKNECNMINTLSQAYEYVERVNMRNLGLLADFYHMNIESDDVREISRFYENLHYVHVADTHRLFPGSGDYPFSELKTVLEEIGYQGPISVECTWKDPQKEIPLAASFLKKF